ncbi:uncharacterized protein LOC113214562 isoform X2 [Frankliniella occidentalis]|uniref:Uncharacterized protein LOC113214562 isoform X2 n=1 Tax=Frankliniella occidentalis TaxID=133901 RepID=A0A9C6XBN4_FRAOC|nr:uncharacterized protein LOC113214562 isoform X2 [Frankliniella occidentalis]
MLIYTELMRVGNLNYAVISVTTGAPVLAVLCSHLAYLSAEWPVRHWWLELGSPFFYMFVASAALLFVLFVLLSCSVTRRLSALRAAKLSASEAAGLDSRSGLVCRASTLFVASAAMQASSLAFVNLPEEGGAAGPGAGPIAFGSSAAVLGVLIVFCYAVRPEAPCGPVRSPPHRGKAKEATKEDNDGSLTFFTKQDANAESEGGAPLDLIRKGGAPHSLQQAESVGAVHTAVWGPYEGAYCMPEGVATRVCVELIGDEVFAGGMPAVMRCNLESGAMLSGAGGAIGAVGAIGAIGPLPCAAVGSTVAPGPSPDGATYTTTSFVIGDPGPIAMPPVTTVPVITVTRTDQEQAPVQDADMLNRISQDLDYLLNRTPPPAQPQGPPPPTAPALPTMPTMPVSILRRRPSCTMTIQEAVQEEDEEEAEAEVQGNLVVA